MYVCLTFVVLIFLNIYTSGTSQKLFYQDKEAEMIEKCQNAAAQIAELAVITPSTVSSVVSRIEGQKLTRMLITDKNGIVVYDSLLKTAGVGKYAMLPEIVRAMEGSGNNVFYWKYHDGAMESRAAAPVVSYGTMIGCVYMTEYDTDQGALIKSLQQNVLTITIILEILVILFSIVFSRKYNRRFRSILTSMRIIREGDYTHKVVMGGGDELSLLGDEFNNLTDKLQTSENKRHQFVGDASHELKTPLASIKLLTDSILQNDMDMETVREFVGDIGNEADRLNRMSQKLLSLSKIESQQDADCEIVPIGPTVQRAARMLKGTAENNNISIDLQLEEDCPILVLEDDLYQIVFNLMENGIKYNTPGGTLTVKLSRSKENAILQVADTGVGIPEDAVSHVFERFYRVDKARSRKTGGSGLGLSIVRNLVERNHGRIDIESTMGVGTTFSVTFPAFDADEEDRQ